MPPDVPPAPERPTWLRAHWTRWAAHPRLRRWRWMGYPLGLFAATRLALLLFSYLAMTIAPSLYFQSGPRGFLSHYPALDGLCRWDCGFFELIAREGYTSIGATNFFPLYPLLARGLHLLTGLNLLFALLVVPNLAGLAAYLVLYRLFADLEGEAAARWALAIFAVYPFAFFHAAAYPESLMVLSSALALQLAMKGRPIRAGAVLGLGVLARHLTLLAGAGLLFAYVRQRGFQLKRLLLTPAILGLILPWVALGAWCLYQYEAFGNPLGFWIVRKNWGAYAYWGVLELLRSTDQNMEARIMWTYLPFALVPTAGGLLLLARQRWLELAAFAVPLLILLWAVGMYGLGRYTASCWPAALPLGVWLSNRPGLQAPVIALLALFQGLFFFLFAHQYPIL